MMLDVTAAPPRSIEIKLPILRSNWGGGEPSVGPAPGSGSYAPPACVRVQDTGKNRTYINNFADYFIYQICTASGLTPRLVHHEGVPPHGVGGSSSSENNFF